VISCLIQNLLVSADCQGFAGLKQHCITTASGAAAHLHFAGGASTLCEVNMLYRPCFCPFFTSLHLYLTTFAMLFDTVRL